MTPITERANAWIVGSDTGSSSEAIWHVMMGGKAKRHAYPSDGGDLGRCLRLLELIPEWKPRLKEMAAVSPYWAALVANWDELARLHALADHRPVYERMKQILDPIEKADPNVFRWGEGVTVRLGR